MKSLIPILLPFPKKINMHSCTHVLKSSDKICFSCNAKDALFPIARRLKEIVKKYSSVDMSIIADKTGSVNFIYNKQLNAQSYKICIDTNEINIEYSNYSGAFYAVSTLKQLIIQYGNMLPTMNIEDEPDYKRRGIMIDISRDKIPNMETLYNIVDFMSDIKLNELQLYVEGFSFAYPSFPKVWSDGTPITPEEIMLLDNYCRDRHIELVANQNSFGHMSAWLNRKEFEHLADCPEGCLTPWGTLTKNSTLNPLDEGSMELVKSLYDDLIPNFTSEYFNVGLDEPFELGHGKSKAETDKLGVGRVYLDYLLKIYTEVKTMNKRMMFWGDIIINSPELIPELPKDIIALEWGYEGDYPFEQNCQKYKDAGIEFYVCPGTSSWNSILGRTDNMKENLLNAAVNGLANDAIGFLNTDWGDNGHIQYLPISYPSFCYGAALSWSIIDNKDIDLAAYLNLFVFKDDSNIMGQLIMDLGNYYLKETVKVSNGTKLFWILNSDINEEKSFEELILKDYEEIENYINNLNNMLDNSRMKCEDAELIYRELRNGVRYILHSINRIRLGKGIYKDKQSFVNQLEEELKVVMKEHSDLWIKRNRVGGLEQSLEYMRRLLKQYKEASCFINE